MHACAHRDGEANDKRLRLREVGGRVVRLDQPVCASGGEQRGSIEAGRENQLDSVGTHFHQSQRVVANECIGARWVLVEGCIRRPCPEKERVSNTYFRITETGA